MASRRTSSSSSDSDAGNTSRNVRGASEVSQTASQRRDRSPTNTIEGNSIAETGSLRSATPTSSLHQTGSIHTTTSQQQKAQTTAVGGIPVIRPPTIQQSTGTGVGVFGPQHPHGAPNQPPLNINVAAAQQQYQQRGAPAQLSSSTGSTSSGTSGSQSSPGSASIQHPTTVNAPRVVQPTNPAPHRPATHQAGPQFPNQIPAQQVYNELLGPDAFKDVILDIDYGVLGSLNVPFQSSGDFSDGQLPPGINVRPAYTTVDSLSYQQHMFNTSRTIYGDGSGDQQHYDFGAAASQGQYDYPQGAGHFDAAKAIFNQVDTNHDGSISRDEFQQWAQGGHTAAGGGGGYAHETHQYQHQHQHQHQQNFNQGTVLEGNNPAIANILHQSGLGQALHR